MRRYYNGQAPERRRVDNSKEVPFVQRNPTQSKDEQGYSPHIRPEEGSHLISAQDQGRGHADAKEVEKEEEEEENSAHSRPPSPPTSNEASGTTLNGYRSDVGIGLNRFDDPEEADQDPNWDHDESDSSTSVTIDSSDPSLGGLDASAEPIMDEEVALGNLARSREADAPSLGEAPQPEENSLWSPLIERDETEVELQSAPLGIDQQMGGDQDTELDLDAESRTIHVLGTGPTGKYIAHALASLPEAPPVTLLMHTPLLMQQWHEEGAKIQVLRNGKINTTSKFDIESSSHIQRQSPEQRFPGFGENLEHTAEPPDTVIDCLIVTTEGHTTVAALSSMKHRLRRTSTVCFIQDGLGVANLADSVVFPDPETRPAYMLGNMSHDLVPTPRKFTLYEKQAGRIFLTISPRSLKSGFRKEDPLVKRIDYNWTPTSAYLMRTLSRPYDLGAVGLAQTEFYEIQLQKLAINSVIGPLSVMFDCFNDELLCNYQVSRTMKLLLKEISTILHRLPEVSRSAKKEQRFSAEKLESIIVGVLGKTGKNSTKMREAVRKGERTDVDFYNGYLVSRAAELCIDCPHLEMMLAMVKGKQAMKSKERNSMIPFKV